jgi:hypothetical protein
MPLPMPLPTPEEEPKLEAAGFPRRKQKGF